MKLAAVGFSAAAYIYGYHDSRVLRWTALQDLCAGRAASQGFARADFRQLGFLLFVSAVVAMLTGTCQWA
jgi:hypothetical protein